MLNKARELGMSIALDDFGTGFSSLSIVDQLPLDKLKIDQSLIKNMESSSKNDTIIRTAIQMAKQLDLECCIEGVESKLVAIKVASLGASYIQGYFIGRPDVVLNQVNDADVGRKVA